ncbi:MAG: 7-cyano-7-deazaguanine synthase QueC [Nitrospirae bacterium]|nr:7-cyano-7-deazaguanine synthase QueC [Nitrospirota bacterium]
MKQRKHPEKAIVLLSGGLDSATTLAIAKEAGYDLYALTFDYQQRHVRELESARSLASALGVKKHLIIDVSLRDIGGSALTSDLNVPKKGIQDSGSGAGEKKNQSPIPNTQPLIPITYVPARNTIFLSLALAWAEVLETGTIFIGANAVDYSGYPDCRPEYLRAFEKMANLATKASVEGSLHFHVRAPLISMTKAEIIRKGIELGIDYALTWSCYDPQPAKTDPGSKIQVDQKAPNVGAGHLFSPCRKCDSCRLREKGFKEAGLKDPLISM